MAAAIGLTPVLPAGGPVMVASCAAVLALAVRPPRGPRGRGGRSMSGTTMFVYVPDVFAIRMFGGFGLARLIGESEQWKRLLTLLPLAIVASVVAVQVFTSGRQVVLDARVVGVGFAAVLAWKRVPLGIVVMAAAATALTRAAGWG